MTSGQSELPHPWALPAADDAGFHAFWAAEVSGLEAWAINRLWRYEIPSGRLQAEDVVQHLWVVMYEAWPSITTNPRGYLYRAARNYLYSQLRDQARVAGTGLTPPDGYENWEQTVIWSSCPVPEGADIPLLAAEDERLWRVRRARLPAALSRLSPRQRQAMVGCVAQRRPRAEVAREMGVAVNTISSHIDRGQGSMKKILKWGAIALLVFFVVSQPGDAAGLLRAIGSWFSEGEEPPPTVYFYERLVTPQMLLAALMFILGIGMVAALRTARSRAQRRRRRPEHDDAY